MHRLKISFLATVLALAAAAVPQAPAEAAPATAGPHDLTHTRIMSLAANMAAQPAAQARAGTLTAAPPLNIHAAANSRLRREVLGFVDAGNLGDASVGYPSWNFSLLSTVVFFGLQVNSGDGNLVTNNTGWYVYHSSTMSSFVATAHANGTRVLVSLNLHDFSTSPTNQTCLGLAPTSAQNTIKQAVAQVAAAGIDGVNVDYEGTNSNCYNGQTSRSEMTSFVQNLRTAMPNGEIVVDTYTGSAEDNLEFFDVTGLAPYLDAFFVMAYDMDYSNASELPLSCTSFCFNPSSPLNTYRFNVTKSMTQYTALVPSSKVILGQPYYGRKGCVAQPDIAHQYLDLHQYRAAPPNFVAPTYLDATSIASDPSNSSYHTHRDPGDGVSEWDTFWSSDFGCWREQYWDDPVSLGAKYDVVNADNLRGVGLFTLDYGGGARALWNELTIKFTTTTPWYPLGGSLTSGPDATASSATRTDVFVRGTDNGLWQDTWNGTAWTWSRLGGILTSDPTAAALGSTRIDVFVRGTDNGLWQDEWDGTHWSGWYSLGGRLVSAPEAVWSGNRLDVFAAGTDNGLWHLYWDSAGWHGWQSLGGILTSDPGTVSWSSSEVDVFARGTDGGLWRRSYNGSWQGWQSLGGALFSAPEASSCAPGHLDVFAVGGDGALYRLGYNGAWTAWQRLGGYWTSDASAVCAPGATAAGVFERGPDYALWQTSIPAT